VIESAIAEIGETIRDLRDLANGLHPSVLADGGLPAALDSLTGRLPQRVKLDVPPVRFAPHIEEALWFVTCEAVANVVKHAHATTLYLAVSTNNAEVSLRCRDDGIGGADRCGGGLRGLADRVEALGGTLCVQSPQGAGTTIEAVIPCES
jgi:signal transduction histidine kinase